MSNYYEEYNTITRIVVGNIQFEIGLPGHKDETVIDVGNYRDILEIGELEKLHAAVGRVIQLLTD